MGGRLTTRRKAWIAVGAVLAVAGLGGGVAVATRPDPNDALKQAQLLATGGPAGLVEVSCEDMRQQIVGKPVVSGVVLHRCFTVRQKDSAPQFFALTAWAQGRGFRTAEGSLKIDDPMRVSDAGFGYTRLQRSDALVSITLIPTRMQTKHRWNKQITSDPNVVTYLELTVESLREHKKYLEEHPGMKAFD